jgi:two-component system KDP operon response regulator KdpE
MTFSLFASKTLVRSLMMMGSVMQEAPLVNPSLAEHQEGGQPMGRVLVADADYSVRRTLHTALLAAGFEVTEASGVDETLALAQVVRCEVILLDAGMPGRRSVEICGELRACCPGLRVLIMTGDEEREQLEALDAGADDCITKPLRMSEAMARVRAAMRRTKSLQIPGHVTIHIGEIEANLSRRVVYKSGNKIHLTPKEFDLLVYLMMNAGIPIPHERILTTVWGPEHASRLDYLRTFVAQLRRKLEDRVDAPRYLLTNNYIGYSFADRSELAVG